MVISWLLKVDVDQRVGGGRMISNVWACYQFRSPSHFPSPTSPILDHVILSVPHFSFPPILPFTHSRILLHRDPRGPLRACCEMKLSAGGARISPVI